MALLVSFSTLYLFCCVISTTIGDDAAYMSKLAKALTPTPSGWSLDTHFCKWTNVECDKSNRVTKINLLSKSLTGTLPSDLNSLSHLTLLVLAHNALSGSLPSLANLTMLETIILDNNTFTSIPNGCFQGPINLQILSLNNNINLAPWTFPTDLTQSTLLVTLRLVATNIMGSLPEIFDSFWLLEDLHLSYNSITGDLPKSFADSEIASLWLNNNGLSGTIDVLSSMNKLSQAWLQYNQFTGPIPDLSNCTELFDLQLRDNMIIGVVPPSLMHHSSLQNVSLDNNKLQGPMPMFEKAVKVTLNGINSFCLDTAGPCDPRVTTLLEIAAAFRYPILLADSWGGNNPCHDWHFIMCQEEKIVTVDLARQNLTGTISPVFANLTDLRNLDLSGNNLMGSVPQSLTTLSQLETLDVSNNNLSGVVPMFPPRVKLNNRGNVLLPSPEGGGGPNINSSNTAKHSKVSPGWIAGGLAASAGLVLFTVIICNRKKCLSFVQRRIFKKPDKQFGFNTLHQKFLAEHLGEFLTNLMCIAMAC